MFMDKILYFWLFAEIRATAKFKSKYVPYVLLKGYSFWENSCILPTQTPPTNFKDSIWHSKIKIK